MKIDGNIEKNDTWILGEDIPDIDLFFAQIWLSCFVNEFKSPGGLAYKKVMTLWRGYHLWFYYGEKDSNKVGEHLVDKIVNNPNFAVLINKNIIGWSDKLRSFANKLPEDNLQKLSNQDLLTYYKKHDQIHTAYYQWGWLPVAVDMFHNNFTNKLKDYLIGLSISKNKLNEYLVLLTQPTEKSLIQLEQEDFLKIASKIQNDRYHNRLFKDLFKFFEEQQVVPYGLSTHTPEYEKLLAKKIDVIRGEIRRPIWNLIQNHYQKYYYVKFMWIGQDGVNTFDHYLKEFVKFIGRSQNARKLLKNKQVEQKSILNNRKRLIKRLGIRGKWLTIFDAWGDFMVTKIYRRYAQIYAVYRMQPILQEIANRLKISLKQVRFMLGSEIELALLHNQINRKELAQRGKFGIYCVEKNYEEFFVGKKAVALSKQIKYEHNYNLQEIKGQTGCVGKARGIVKVIIRPSDMAKMNKGDILVSIATDPDIVPAMKKAAAIVTEQGGVTSHAAIVSRELNIPCLIGTKIATKVLKDGDMVEVDATLGIVKKLN